MATIRNTLAALIALGAALLLLSGPLPAAAQSPLAAQPAADAGDANANADALETPEAVRALVARLSDEDVRAMLLERLDAVAAGQAADAGSRGGLAELSRNATTGVGESVATAIERAPLIGSVMGASLARFEERIGPDGLWIIVALMTLGVLGGLAAERLFERACARWMPPPTASGDSLRGSIAFLAYRLMQDIAGVLVFLLVAETIGYNLAIGLYGDRPNIETIGAYAEMFWTYMIVLPRLGAAFSRFLLAPSQPALRLVHTDDASAVFLHRRQVELFIFIGFYLFIFQFNAANGVAMGEARIGFWLNLALHIAVAAIAYRAREGLVLMMRGPGEEVTPTEERVARAYPWFAIAVSAGSWWLTETLVAYEAWDLLRGGPQFWTMGLLLMTPAMDTLVRGLVRHLSPPMTGDGPLAERAYRATKRSYIHIGRLIVLFFLVIGIAELWGIDLANLAAAGVGAQLAGRLLEVVLTLATGYIIWELVGLWFNRKLAAEQTAQGVDLSAEEPAGGEGGGVGGSRLSTVLPLAHGAAKAAIAVIFALLALGSIGVDITPLLAGAGIVGLAIGFGAQKLVADVVSGVFFLIDDAFRTGEYVEVDGTVGTVERISIRSMQLRHHRGAVHTIPFGEIPKLTNYSRDWVIMKLKFTVPFDTDPQLVKKIFKKIGTELSAEPEFAADMLQPFKSQGVFDFDDVGMIVRGKFMARPGRQFTLRKEVFNRVKAAFEANGVEFARREVRVALPGRGGAAPLSDAEREAIASAAGEAAQRAGAAPGAAPPTDDR